MTRDSQSFTEWHRATDQRLRQALCELSARGYTPRDNAEVQALWNALALDIYQPPYGSKPQ
jgi:hypothetical protein